MRKENMCACGITPPNTPFPEGSQTTDITTIATSDESKCALMIFSQ